MKEHLQLFAGIKGHASDAEIEELMEHFDLKDSATKMATVLSGGQKRKLCVALALLGGSKIVILDEPTAGMDVFARRKMWEALRQHRSDRVILVTSHLLEEIDALTDRKAVLSHGCVRCVGTSLFLKTKFGVGYSV